MTAISRCRGRRAVRTAAAVGAVSVGLAVLSACSKPTPYTHYTLGGDTSSHETADGCYGHGRALHPTDAQRCAQAGGDIPVFETQPGDTFRLGVDPEVADTGWLMLIDGSLFNAEPFASTYRSLPSDQLFAALQQPGQQPPSQLQITVVQVTEDYDAERLRAAASQPGLQEQFQQELYGHLEGVWNVRLATAD